MPLRLSALCLVLAAASALAHAAAHPHRPVLLISIDGMRTDYVTRADEHHLRVPHLRHIMVSGAYADGVLGVLPTVTYPSHTTLVTGVWPAEHGILDDIRFDPERKFSGAWYWYADQIKVPTLWDAAHAAGLHTASVGWPVTVDATSIDENLPEYWRSSNPGNSSNPDDRLLMDAISRPDGEIARITARTGVPYMMGNDTSIAGDETKTVYSLDILQQHRPQFMTIHLSSLDEAEHLHGPFSAEANAALEAIDGMVQRLETQELANYPSAVIVIVSDHGFAPVEHAVNFAVPFLSAGLMHADKNSSGKMTITSWKAEPWIAGCVTPIILHDLNDTVTRDKVRILLRRLASDPANGIEAVLDHNATVALGGFPDAAFLVTLKLGYCNGGALTGPLVTASSEKGAHGYNIITTPEMRSAFFITGRGVSGGKDLGVIDMRQIAPTLARILGVTLKTAKQPALLIQ